MTKQRRVTILTIALIAVLTLAALLVLSGCRDEARAVRERIAIEANADSYIKNGYDLLMYSDDKASQTLALEGSAGNIDAEGTLDVAGDVTASADVVVGLFGRLTAQTAITVTGGGTLTPTGTYQPIQAAGTVGLSDIAVTTAGDVLVLTNISATTVTITDTSTTMLNANRALAQYDTLVLLCDGTNWLELSFTNN